MTDFHVGVNCHFNKKYDWVLWLLWYLSKRGIFKTKSDTLLNVCKLTNYKKVYPI